MHSKKSLIYHAKHPHVLKMAVKTALIVGTILALINHYDSIFALRLTSTQVMQVVLTYLVPFSVASYAAARHAQQLHELEDKVYRS